jgi:hypothetical protein
MSFFFSCLENLIFIAWSFSLFITLAPCKSLGVWIFVKRIMCASSGGQYQCPCLCYPSAVKHSSSVFSSALWYSFRHHFKHIPQSPLHQSVYCSGNDSPDAFQLLSNALSLLSFAIQPAAVSLSNFSLWESAWQCLLLWYSVSLNIRLMIKQSVLRIMLYQLSYKGRWWNFSPSLPFWIKLHCSDSCWKRKPKREIQIPIFFFTYEHQSQSHHLAERNPKETSSIDHNMKKKQSRFATESFEPPAPSSLVLPRLLLDHSTLTILLLYNLRN